MRHPQFFGMVRYAVDHGVPVTINTNLTLLKAERTKHLVKSGLDALFFSIDGSTAETYVRICERAHFERVLSNMERLLEIRKQFSSELPHLRLVMVIMRQNLHELPNLVKLAHQ